MTGGRTSCVVPSVQKKTGPVAGDINLTEEANGDAESPKGKGRKAGGKKGLKVEEGDMEGEDEEPATKGKGETKERNLKAKKEQPDVVHGEHNGDSAVKSTSKKRKSASTNGTDEAQKKAKTEGIASGRRRSARVGGSGA